MIHQINTSSLVTMVASLSANASTLSTLVSNAGNQKKIDLVSAQTFYGLPEAAVSDLEQANDLILLCIEKLKTSGAA